MRLRVLAESGRCSAAQVVADASVGDPRDPLAVRAFAAGCDVLTFDHEHVPADLLRALEADGVAVRPSAQALAHAQDKAVMRARLATLGVPMPALADRARRRGARRVRRRRRDGPSCSRRRGAGTTARASWSCASPADADGWLARLAAEEGGPAAGAGLLAEE